MRIQGGRRTGGECKVRVGLKEAKKLPLILFNAFPQNIR